MMMAMLPLMIQMIQGAGKGGMEGGNGMGGQDARFSSTYGPGGVGLVEDLQNQVKGMSGQRDITQNPNYQSGSNWLQGLYNDPQFFKDFEAPIQRQFREQTIPELSNQFAGMGTHGATGSTGFRNALAREGSTLQEKIAAIRGGLQQQGVNQSLGYAQQPTSNLLQLQNQALTPTNNQFQPATAGFWGDIISSLSGGAAKGVGNWWGQQMAPGTNASGNPLKTNVSLPNAANQAMATQGWG